jgi:hypothetical protein
MYAAKYELYSNCQFDNTLPGEGNQVFNKYREIIRSATEETNLAKDQAQTWYLAATNIINQIILDVFADYGVDPKKIKYQFYVCGSLAKRQATPYSDFDAFIIWEDPQGDPVKLAEIAKIKEALDGLYNLINRIFLATKQFCPDPVGINPKSCKGTPAKLFAKIQQDDFGNAVFLINAINTAKPLMNDGTLLSELLEKMDAQNSECLAGAYNKLVTDYKGPRSPDIIDLKVDILRPLDFFAMGLREEFGINLDEGDYLHIAGTVRALTENGDMSREFGDLVLSIYQDAIKFRMVYHLLNKKETDSIDLNELSQIDSLSEQLKLKPNQTPSIFIQQLIHKVAIIRGVAKERLESPSLPASKIELKSIKEFPYETTVGHKNEINFDLSPYVFGNPARDFFVKNSRIIHENLARYDSSSDGSNEKIFSNFPLPDHLNFLVSLLNNLIELDANKIETHLETWLKEVRRNAKSDLFNKEGELHPWLQKIFRHEDFTQKQHEQTKKLLLTGYINQLVAASCAQYDQENPHKSAENLFILINSKLVNQTAKISASKKEMRELVQKGDQQYEESLKRFTKIVERSIVMLKQMHQYTADKALKARIQSKIIHYEQLIADTSYVLSQQTSETKREFFHKIMTHFQSDLTKFEKEIKTSKPNLWARFKQSFANIRLSFLVFFRIKEKMTIGKMLEETFSLYNKSAEKAANADIPADESSPLNPKIARGMN